MYSSGYAKPLPINLSDIEEYSRCMQLSLLSDIQYKGVEYLLPIVMLELPEGGLLSR